MEIHHYSEIKNYAEKYEITSRGGGGDGKKVHPERKSPKYAKRKGRKGKDKQRFGALNPRVR